jgi:hypothetical protein
MLRNNEYFDVFGEWTGRRKNKRYQSQQERSVRKLMR